MILVYEVMEKIWPEDIGQERPKKVLEEQSDSGKTEIFAVDVRDEALINRLTQVWRKSVKATHLFLSDEEVEQIAVYVPEALKIRICWSRRPRMAFRRHSWESAAVSWRCCLFYRSRGGKVWEAGCSGMESDDTGLMKSV